MNKIIKDQVGQLKPSATLAINEESNRLKKNGKKVYKFGFGQSPFPVPESIVAALKNSANKNTTKNYPFNKFQYYIFIIIFYLINKKYKCKT